MPVSYTRDALMLALCREAFKDQYPIDITTTSAGAATGLTGVFGQLAFTTSGATSNKYHDIWVYWRRFRGTVSTVTSSTQSALESGHTFSTSDALKNFTFKIVSGTGSGQEATITASSTATPTVITHAAFTTGLGTDSIYEIYPNSTDSREGDHFRSVKADSSSSLTVASGTLNWHPAIQSNATDSLVVAEVQERSDMIFTYDIQGDLLLSYISQLLRNMRSPAYLPVTMIPDGDMEGSYTIGTSASFTEWSGVDAPTTAAKSTTSYPFPFGRQYINVVTAATDNEGIQSATVAVDPDENMHVAVLVQKTPAATETASFDVILYDVTNSTDLKTVTVTGQQPALVYFQQSLASTTEEVAIRVLSNSAAATSFRVGPTWLWSGSKDRYAVDTSSLERGRDINNAVTLRLGQEMETDVYHIGKLEDTVFDAERDDRANLLHVVIPRSSRPTLLQTDRRYVELTYDSQATFAERDMVVQGAMYHVERARAARLASSNPALAGFHNSRAREYARTYSQMLEGTGISLVDVEDESSDRQLVRFR